MILLLGHQTVTHLPHPVCATFPVRLLESSLSNNVTHRSSKKRMQPFYFRRLHSTFEILPVPPLLCGKEAEGVRSSSLISFRSPSLPIRAPSPLLPTATVAHSRFLFHGCSRSQKRSRMKNAYSAFRVEITLGGEQERRFKVQSDALQPCCSVLPPQIELISIDREGGRGLGGDLPTGLHLEGWLGKLSFPSDNLHHLSSHLFSAMPVQRRRWIALLHMVAAVQSYCMDMGGGQRGWGGAMGWQLDRPHSSDGRGLRRSARQMPVRLARSRLSGRIKCWKGPLNRRRSD